MFPLICASFSPSKLLHFIQLSNCNRETHFRIGELNYKLFDVGGQRSERKKWIHCFENVTAIIFLVAISEYDQLLYEDQNVVSIKLEKGEGRDSMEKLCLSTKLEIKRIQINRPRVKSISMFTISEPWSFSFLSFQNRMQEALTLFDSICNSRWFVRTSIILFLNKIDLFKQKLTYSPMSDYFSDYQGGSDYNSACEYIVNRFVSLNQSDAKTVYTHL